MRAKVDFQLNRRFGIVEQIIFRLVLNGCSSVKEISSILTLFSDSVMANAIINLVNNQILSVDMVSRKFSLSESLLAIIEMCLEKEYELNIPNELIEEFENEGIIISNLQYEESKMLKKIILCELLPGIKLNIYVNSIDFIIYKAESGDNDE